MAIIIWGIRKRYKIRIQLSLPFVRFVLQTQSHVDGEQRRNYVNLSSRSRFNVRSIPSFSFTSSGPTVDNTPSTSSLPSPATDPASYPRGTNIALTLPETHYMETPAFPKEHVGFGSHPCHYHDYKCKNRLQAFLLLSKRRKVLTKQKINEVC
jgi:hypothetical protein